MGPQQDSSEVAKDLRLETPKRPAHPSGRREGAAGRPALQCARQRRVSTSRIWARQVLPDAGERASLRSLRAELMERERDGLMERH